MKVEQKEDFMTTGIPAVKANVSASKVNTVFYNDLHGTTKNIKQFAVAQDEFYKHHGKQRRCFYGCKSE